MSAAAFAPPDCMERRCRATLTFQLKLPGTSARNSALIMTVSKSKRMIFSATDENLSRRVAAIHENIRFPFVLAVATSAQAQLPTASPQRAGVNPARLEVLH